MQLYFSFKLSQSLKLSWKNKSSIVELNQRSSLQPAQILYSAANGTENTDNGLWLIRNKMRCKKKTCKFAQNFL